MEKKSNFRSQNPDLDWLKGMQPKTTSILSQQKRETLELQKIVCFTCLEFYGFYSIFNHFIFPFSEGSKFSVYFIVVKNPVWGQRLTFLVIVQMMMDDVQIIFLCLRAT